MNNFILHHISKKEKGWTIKTHSRHGDKSYHKKHVHVSKNGLKGEYSWNDDGTRHDEHKFPSSEKSIVKAKELAASALGVDASTLQFIAGSTGGVWYKFESNRERMSTYVHKGKMCLTFEIPQGLVTVIVNKA